MSSSLFLKTSAFIFLIALSACSTASQFDSVKSESFKGKLDKVFVVTRILMSPSDTNDLLIQLREGFNQQHIRNSSFNYDTGQLNIDTKLQSKLKEYAPNYLLKIVETQTIIYSNTINCARIGTYEATLEQKNGEEVWKGTANACYGSGALTANLISKMKEDGVIKQ